jgi:thioesterase domain-containing protein
MRYLPDRPLYGLQARGITQPQAAPRTLAEMATDYLDLIRRTQPVGPYNLLGWSFGGLVAHAIATRLQQQGESVALLALLDSYPIEAGSQPQPDHDFDDERFLAEQLKALGYYSGDKPLQLSSAMSILRREGDIHSNLDEHQIGAIIEVFKQNGRLAAGFAPQQFDGDVLLFAAMRSTVSPAVDRWKPHVTGRIAVHEVDCEHMHMMRPAALARIGPVLASKLADLSRADSDGNAAETATGAPAAPAALASVS